MSRTIYLITNRIVKQNVVEQLKYYITPPLLRHANTFGTYSLSYTMLLEPRYAPI